MLLREWLALRSALGGGEGGGPYVSPTPDLCEDIRCGQGQLRGAGWTFDRAPGPTASSYERRYAIQSAISEL
ncbi:hypothetical protein [Embleya sp. NBC_00896]|uniref:hypothetical protein n=1 Tax=Embleya sp. NBC_00896 TaxID=2975961 RepID=UPI002F911FD1|nr:hypothetical protein OG928_40165 [Embleya sp. NBC_00896]